MKQSYAPSSLEQVANVWLRNNTRITTAGDARVKEFAIGDDESQYVRLWNTAEELTVIVQAANITGS